MKLQINQKSLGFPKLTEIKNAFWAFNEEFVLENRH